MHAHKASELQLSEIDRVGEVRKVLFDESRHCLRVRSSCRVGFGKARHRLVRCLRRFALPTEDDSIQAAEAFGLLEDDLRDVRQAPSKAKLGFVQQRKIAPVTSVILWVRKHPSDRRELLS